MHIAVVNTTGDIRTPGRRGLGDLAWGMAEGLAASGHDVTFVSTEPARPGFDRRVQLRELSVLRFAGQGRLGQVQKIVRIVRELRSLPHIDFVYTTDLMPAALLASLTPTRIVYAPANFSSAMFKAGNFSPSLIRTGIIRTQERLAAGRSDVINVPSSVMETCWVSIGASPHRVVRMPYGVDGQHFVHIDGARAALDLDPRQFIIMYTGRLSREKNLGTLVDAVADLNDPERKVMLCFLGDGADQARLEQRAEQLSVRTRFVQWRPWTELPVWYSAANVCVLPSLWEAFGRVMAESMACGTPFVGASGTGMEDYLVHESNGLLCDPRSTRSVAAAIDRVRRDPAFTSKMVARAREYAVDTFSWPRVARVLVDEVEHRLEI